MISEEEYLNQLNIWTQENLKTLGLSEIPNYSKWNVLKKNRQGMHWHHINPTSKGNKDDSPENGSILTEDQHDWAHDISIAPKKYHVKNSHFARAGIRAKKNIRIADENLKWSDPISKIYRIRKPLMIMAASRAGVSREDAEDLIQDIFIKHLSGETQKYDQPPSTHFGSRMSSAISHFLGRGKLEIELEDVFLVEDCILLEDSEWLADELIKSVKLSKREYEFINLFYFKGLKIQEIMKLKNIKSKGAVVTPLSRARDKIKHRAITR